MSRIVPERICKHCDDKFLPDWRNRNRQLFCQRPECRKASHAQSQARWLARNPDYFRSAKQVQKTQDWRKAHPDYAKRKPQTPPAPLPDILKPQVSEPKLLAPKPSAEAAQPLQDVFRPLQDSIILKSLIIGLLAHQFDCTLQEDIGYTMRRLISKGMAVLGRVPGAPLNANTTHQNYDAKETPPSRTAAPHPAPVQLAGSPPGAG